MVHQRSLMLPFLLFTSSITALQTIRWPSPHPLSISFHPDLSPRGLATRQTSESCDTGSTCASCFGTGYVECPSDPYSCYDPNDSTTYCPGDGSTTDYCNGVGATCASCFGPGFIDCPNDDINCYDPSNSTTYCPDGTRGGGSGGGGSSSSIGGGGLPIFGTSTRSSASLATSSSVLTTSSVAVITSTSVLSTSSAASSSSSTAAGTTTTSVIAAGGSTTPSASASGVPGAGVQAIGDIWWTGIIGGVFGGVLLNNAL